LKNKDRAQFEKKVDKEKIERNPEGNFLTATFDLQSVLQIPSGSVSQLYYKRKLVLHNLTIFDGLKEGYCFMWLETDGKRGSNEVGSISYRYLSTLPPSVTEVRLFSDSCSGQNRNQYVAAVLLYAVRNLHLEIIEQKVLIPGHTQMECDSMRSAVEHAHKYTSTYSPEDWKIIMRSARRRKPYHVEQLYYTDFYDLKDLAGQILPNRKQNTKGGTVN